MDKNILEIIIVVIIILCVMALGYIAMRFLRKRREKVNEQPTNIATPADAQVKTEIQTPVIPKGSDLPNGKKAKKAKKPAVKEPTAAPAVVPDNIEVRSEIEINQITNQEIGRIMDEIEKEDEAAVPQETPPKNNCSNKEEEKSKKGSIIAWLFIILAIMLIIGIKWHTGIALLALYLMAIVGVAWNYQKSNTRRLNHEMKEKIDKMTVSEFHKLKEKHGDKLESFLLEQILKEANTSFWTSLKMTFLRGHYVWITPLGAVFFFYLIFGIGG